MDLFIYIYVSSVHGLATEGLKVNGAKTVYLKYLWYLL
jgi:hypothetical protein